MTYGIFDSSYKLIVKKEGADESHWFDVLRQCYYPFSFAVWSSFIFLTFLTAILYLYVEKGGEHTSFTKGKMYENVASSSLNTFMELSSGGTMNPYTWPGRLVVCSWSWFAVLFLGAYTANLASFLVHKDAGKSTFDTLEAAMHAQAQICMDDLVHEWWTLSYPAYTRTLVFQSVTGTEVFQGLLDGQCSCVLAPHLLYRTVEVKPDFNPDCRLEEKAHTLNRQEAGWVAQIDYSERCTRLVGDVLNYYFLEMENEGILDSRKNDYFKSGGDQDCRLADQDTDHLDATPQLNILNMAGMILVHVVLLALALFIYLAYHHITRRVGKVRLDGKQIANERGDCVESSTRSSENIRISRDNANSSSTFVVQSSQLVEDSKELSSDVPDSGLNVSVETRARSSVNIDSGKATGDLLGGKCTDINLRISHGAPAEASGLRTSVSTFSQEVEPDSADRLLPASDVLSIAKACLYPCPRPQLEFSPPPSVRSALHERHSRYSSSTENSCSREWSPTCSYGPSSSFQSRELSRGTNTALYPIAMLGATPPFLGSSKHDEYLRVHWPYDSYSSVGADAFASTNLLSSSEAPLCEVRATSRTNLGMSMMDQSAVGLCQSYDI